MRISYVWWLIVLVPFVPFAIGQEIFIQSKGKKCPLEGTATSEAGKTIDRLKNRFVAPKAADIDAGVTLAGLLAPGDDEGRFDESKGAKIRAFVIDVKVGGVETCNCRAKDPIDRDTHIEIGFTNDAPKTQLVIVEVTPRIRAKMKEAQKDWSTEALKKDLKGKFVEIAGWLLFDTPHIDEAENTHPGGPKNWRATCWEIHPVTSITVLNAPGANEPTLHPSLLAAFHEVHAQHFSRDMKRKERTLSRNKAVIERFDKEELDEDLPK
jgi:hypothetical protein